MADKKITELPNITGADLANADEFAVVDITASQTKAITFGELKTAVGTDFVSKSGSTMTGSLVLNADPTASLQAASKQYVDTIAAAGLHYHDPCRVESSSNLTVTYNNGTAGVGATLTNNSTQVALALDGVTLSSGNRVLVKGQTAQAQNGVYTVTNTGSGSTNWVLTRATDADSYGPSDPDSFGQGDAFFVEEGNTGAGNLDVMNTVGVITFGTTAIVFVNVSASAIYSAGTGVTLTGTQFSIGQAVATTSTPTFGNTTINGTATVDGLTVANTGVPVILIQDTDGTNQKTFLQQSNGANIISAQDGVSHGRTLIKSYNGTNTVERLRVDANGDISFYEDTGTTAKFFWDSSAESLGIGTSSPTSHLEIRGSSGGNGKQLRLSTGSTTYWDLGRSASNGNFEITEDSGDTYFVIDKTSGNVGIGTSSPTGRTEIADNGSVNDRLLYLNSSGGLSQGQTGPFYGLYSDIRSNNNATAAYGGYFKGTGVIGLSYGVFSETAQGASTRDSIAVYGNATVNSGATNHRSNRTLGSGPVAGVYATTTTTGTSMTAQTTALHALNATVYGSEAYGAWIETTAGPTTVVPMKVAHDGSEIMRIDSSGSVGIGTSSPSEKLDVTGNIAVSGVVDGVDISARDSVLTSTTTTANAALPKAGGTMTGDLDFDDGIKANFGDSNDLQIFHSLGNSFVQDAGEGDLFIAGSNAVRIVNSNASETYATFNLNSGVDLYHDNTLRFQTSSTGISVAGNVFVTGTVDGRDIATNIPASLGTAGQVLTVNSGATATEWADASGGGGGGITTGKAIAMAMVFG